VYASPMTPRLRSWTRRHGRIALLLLASGCLSSSSGSGGCTGNAALGQGTFSYACPSADPAGPTVPNADAFCASGTDAGNLPLPDVAVGAPFSLRFDQVTGDGPQPAVASLAQSTPQGWSLTQPGWLGFIEWSGADVVDFTHIHAQAIASIRLEPDLTAAPLPIGSIASMAATPLGAGGVVLGGQITCTFTSSAPEVLSARSESGRVARLAALAVGAVTLTASCVAVQTQVTLQVTAELGPIGTGSDAGAAADAGAGAAADAGAGAGAGAAADAGAGADPDAAPEGGD
jgi:hypothetical protein